MSGVIASECVGHQPPGFTALAFDQATKKPFSRTLIATTLHENIKAIAVLIHGTPQILALPLNGDKDCGDMPRIA
jgi:hypothetical protein